MGVIPLRYLPNVRPKPEEEDADETRLLISGLVFSSSSSSEGIGGI